MPMYEFMCIDCNDTLELILKFDNRNDVILCKKCGGTLKRVPTASSFKINGYSYSNGYNSPEEISYDGSQKPW